MPQEPARNNWYVVTGAPCSGKTTLINELEKRGYGVVPEMARAYINERLARGETMGEIRKDEALFQKDILEKKIDVEAKLPKEQLVFLDRGIPDTEAYDKLYGIASSELLLDAIKKCSYKKVFVLEVITVRRGRRTDGDGGGPDEAPRAHRRNVSGARFRGRRGSGDADREACRLCY